MAREWDFDGHKPLLIAPGIGGIQLDVFQPGVDRSALRQRYDIPVDSPVVVNPRGIRGYVRNDLFFQAVRAVVAQRPETVVVCCGMQGNATVEGWLSELGLAAHVRLLPTLPRAEMADLFRMAQVAVSPSMHDGTPNTLLEAMACGCVPVAGNIESVREWITDGENGLLFDVLNVPAQGAAILRALDDSALRQRAGDINRQQVAAKADYRRVMPGVESFYQAVRAAQNGAK
jgi:glycosyltransferase involved in cell wall biosynthesis